MVLETTQSMVGAEHWPVVLPKHQLQKCTDNVLGATIKEGPNATHRHWHFCCTHRGDSVPHHMIRWTRVPYMLTGQARRHCVPLRPCWVCRHPDGLDFPSLGYNVQIPTCRPKVQKGLVKRLGPVWG